MGLSFILRCEGSVFPKAILMALPNAVLAVLLHTNLHQSQGLDGLMNMTGVDWLWAGYTSMLSFLIVFRNNQAYTRFWEGATLIHQVRGEWFSAVSTLFAFCNRTEEFERPVKTFTNTLVRLTSMLYCSALQQVADVDDDRFEIIESRGMSAESLKFMQDSTDRVEVLMQWIQRLVVEAHAEGTIDIASPLLARAFQEFAQGIVTLNNAHKIKEIPFPFPYSQMITCMLLIHWAATPFITSQLVGSAAAAGFMCFLVTSVLWSQVYITMEIDQPFGEDANDLPLYDMQKDFNKSLLNLMHPDAQAVPTFSYDPPADDGCGSLPPSKSYSRNSIEISGGMVTEVMITDGLTYTSKSQSATSWNSTKRRLSTLYSRISRAEVDSQGMRASGQRPSVMRTSSGSSVMCTMGQFKQTTAETPVKEAAGISSISTDYLHNGAAEGDTPRSSTYGHVLQGGQVSDSAELTRLRPSSQRSSQWSNGSSHRTSQRSHLRSSQRSINSYRASQISLRSSHLPVRHTSRGEWDDSERAWRALAAAEAEASMDACPAGEHRGVEALVALGIPPPMKLDI